MATNSKKIEIEVEDDFTNTEAVVGYGMPSAFMYSVTKSEFIAYKVME